MATSAPPPDAPPLPRKGWFARNWLWAVPAGCLSVLVLAVACIILAVYLLFSSFRDSEVGREALARARASQQLTEALGTPIEAGWFVTGSIKYDQTIGRAELSIPLSGPKGKGTLRFKADKINRAWSFSRLVVELEDGRRFDLLRGTARPGEVQTVRLEPARLRLAASATRPGP